MPATVGSETMTAFYIPGIDGSPGVVERTYDEMRRQVELELGSRPNIHRIAQLWTRREGVDCVTEVGLPDPLRGGTVLAIFDMGSHQPYVIWRHADDGTTTGVREVLGHHAYSVTEFDA
jgi:hypothetical protein